MSFWGNGYPVGFPNIGIEFSSLPRGIEAFGFRIAFYGIIIAIGMLCGIAIAKWQAKRSGQDPEMYMDFALIAIPVSVLGARLYSVAFEWDLYKDDLLQIFNIRNGGLAIYGGIIAAFLCVFVYCKFKKYSFALFADTGVLGLILGQIMGRWGNFFNREAFGKYTDSLFAMKISCQDPSLGNVFKPDIISDARLAELYAGKEKALANIMEIRDHIITAADGSTYVSVQPTFLYESVWNLLLLIGMIVYWPKKKFNGEIFLMYVGGYGFGRFFIEGLRTDQLFLWNTGIPVSQLLAGIAFLVSAGLIVFFRIRVARGKLKLETVAAGKAEKEKSGAETDNEGDVMEAEAIAEDSDGQTKDGNGQADNVETGGEKLRPLKVKAETVEDKTGLWN